MALLYISEYQGVAQVHGGLSAPQEPALVDQTPLAIGGAVQSAAFQSSTKVIRVHCDAICSIVFGPSPQTATTANKRLAANQTEYFGVLPGQVLSVVSNT